MALPRGPRIPSVLGLLYWMARPTESLDRMFAEFGDIYSLRNPLLGTEVVISHPDLVKQVLTGSPDVFLGGEGNRLLGPVFGQGSVLLLDGAAHQRQRRLLLPPFHGERIAAYADVMRETTEKVIAEWPRGAPFSILSSMQRITLEVILRTVFGVREARALDELRRILVTFLERVQSPLGMLWMLPAFQKDLGPLTGWALRVSAEEA